MGGTPAARGRLPEASCTSVASGNTCTSPHRYEPACGPGGRRSFDCTARHESSQDILRHKLCQEVPRPQVDRVLPAKGLGRVSIRRTAQHIISEPSCTSALQKHKPISGAPRRCAATKMPSRHAMTLGTESHKQRLTNLNCWTLLDGAASALVVVSLRKREPQQPSRGPHGTCKDGSQRRKITSTAVNAGRYWQSFCGSPTPARPSSAVPVAFKAT